MKKKFAALVGAVALAGAAVAITGGTYAYFNADSTTGTQRVQAGTLAIDLPGGATGVTPSIDIEKIKPGDRYRGQEGTHNGWTGSSYRLTITNTGTVDGVIEQLAIVDTAPGSTSPNGVNLADRLQARFCDRENPDAPGAHHTAWRPLASATFTGLDGWGRITASGTGTAKDVFLQIQWPNGTPAQDNPYQGTSTQFRVKVTVKQADVGT